MSASAWERLLTDDRFKSADLDTQTQAIGTFYNLKAQKDPDNAELYQQNAILRQGLHRERSLASSEDEALRPFHTAKAAIYAKVAKDSGSEVLDGERSAIVTNRINAINEAESEARGVLSEEKLVGKALESELALRAAGQREITPGNALETGVLGLVDVARGAVSDEENRLEKGLRLFSELNAESGGRGEELVEAAKAERLLEFEGDVTTRKSDGAPVIKPISAVVMSDEQIRKALTEAGSPAHHIEFFMEKRLPAIRKETTGVLATLRERLPDISKLEPEDDNAFAKLLIESARKQGKLTAIAGGFQSTVIDIGSGVLSAVGADQLGEKGRAQASAIRLLNGEIPGGEFASEVAGVAPDLLLALVPGGAAARTGRAAGLSRAAIQRAAVGASAVAGGASAGLRTFGSALDRTGDRSTALVAGLKQAVTTAGVTAAFGARGIESAFAKSGAAKKGLASAVGRVIGEAGSEGLEEATDELIAHFWVERSLNPDASIDEAIANAVHAFELGAVLGGSVAIFTGRGPDEQQQKEEMEKLSADFEAVADQIPLTEGSKQRLRAELKADRQNPGMIKEIAGLVREAQDQLSRTISRQPNAEINLDLQQAEVVSEGEVNAAENPVVAEEAATPGEEAPLADASLPIRRKSGDPFATQKSAKAHITRTEGLSAETHKVSRVDGGFEIRERTEQQPVEEQKEVATEEDAAPEVEESTGENFQVTPEEAEVVESVRDGIDTRIDEAVEKGQIDQGTAEILQKQSGESSSLADLKKVDDTLKAELRLQDVEERTGKKPKKRLNARQRKRRFERQAKEAKAKAQQEKKERAEAEPKLTEQDKKFAETFASENRSRNDTVKEEVIEEAEAPQEADSDVLDLEIDNALEAGQIDQATAEALQALNFDASTDEQRSEVRNQLQDEIAKQPTPRGGTTPGRKDAIADEVEDAVFEGTLPRSEADEFLEKVQNAESDAELTEIFERIEQAREFYRGDPDAVFTEPETRFSKARKGVKGFLNLNRLTEPARISEAMARSIGDSLSKRFGVDVTYVSDPKLSWAGTFNESRGVVLNLAHIRSDVPFHEFSHAFIAAFRRSNPESYKSLIKEFDSLVDRNDPLAVAALRRVNQAYGDEVDPSVLTEEFVAHYLGYMAAGKIDPESGLGAAISKIWDKIIEVVSDVFGILNVTDIPMNITLEGMAEILVDPRTKFDLSGGRTAAARTLDEARSFIEIRGLALAIKGLISSIRTATSASINLLDIKNKKGKTVGRELVFATRNAAGDVLTFAPEEASSFADSLENNREHTVESLAWLEERSGMGMWPQDLTESEMSEWWGLFVEDNAFMEPVFPEASELDPERVMTLLEIMADPDVATSMRNTKKMNNFIAGGGNSEVSQGDVNAAFLLQEAAQTSGSPSVVSRTTEGEVINATAHPMGASASIQNGVMADLAEMLGPRKSKMLSKEEMAKLIRNLRDRLRAVERAGFLAAQGDLHGSISVMAPLYMDSSRRMAKASEKIFGSMTDKARELEQAIREASSTREIYSRHTGLDISSEQDRRYALIDPRRAPADPQTRYARITPPGGTVADYHSAIPDTPDYLLGTGGAKIAPINGPGAAAGRPHKPFSNLAQAASFRKKVAAREGIDPLDLKIVKTGSGKFMVSVPGPISAAARQAFNTFEQTLSNPLAGGGPRVAVLPTTPESNEYLDHPRGLNKILRKIQSDAAWTEHVPVVSALLRGLNSMSIQTAVRDGALRAPIMSYIYKETWGANAARNLARQLQSRHRNAFALNDSGQITNIGNPGGRSVFMQDVFEELMVDPAAYILSPEQQAMVDDMRSVMEQARQMMRGRGMDKKTLDQMGVAPDDFLSDPKKGDNSWRRYFPRLVLGQLDADGKLKAKEFFGAQSGAERRAFDRQRLRNKNGRAKSVEEIKTDPATSDIVYSADPFESIEWFLRNAYAATAAHDLSTDPDLLARSTKTTGTASLGEAVVNGVQVLNDRIFTDEDTAILQKYLVRRGAPVSPGVKAFEAFALGTKNIILGAFDWAAPLTVGKRFTLDPKNWADVPVAIAQAVKGWASESGNDNFIKAHADLYEELTLLNSTAAVGFEYQQAADQISRLNRERGRMGSVTARARRAIYENTVGRNARFHKMYLDAAKVLMWQGMRRRFTDANGNLRVDPDTVLEMQQEVAALDRSLGMSHDIGLSGASAGTRTWLSILLTAPSMYAAFSNQIFDPKGYKHLGAYAAGSYLAYAAAAFLSGMDEEEIFERMLPTNRNWLTVDLKIGDRAIKVGLSSFYRSLVKMFTQLGQNVYADIAGTKAQTFGEAYIDPFSTFAKSRRSPAITMIASLATGEDYFGNISTFEQSLMQNATPLSLNEPLRVWADKNLGPVFRKFGIPFDAATYEEQQHGIFKSGTLAQVFIQFFGINAYSEQGWQQLSRERDDLSERDYGQKYDDLPRTQQQDVAWRLRQKFAEEARPEDKRRWEKFQQLQQRRFNSLLPSGDQTFFDQIGYAMTPLKDQKWDIQGAGNWSAPMSEQQRRRMWEKQIELFKPDIDWAREAAARGELSDDRIRAALTLREEELRERLRHIAP